jgi:hypothetical protein
MPIRSPKLRLTIAVVAACLPARVRRWLLTRMLGYDIAPDAVVGHSIIAVDSLVMRSGSSIGDLCLLRGCERVELGRGASIGFWFGSMRLPGRRPILLAKHASSPS